MFEFRCRILLVEDSREDAELFREMLSDVPGMYFRVVVATTLAQGIEKLTAPDARIDVVVLDLTLPDSTGLATFERLHAADPAAPVVIMSGVADEELAVAAVQAGAQDYVVKGMFDPAWLLARSLRYAIERKKMRDRMVKTEEEFRIAREIQQLLFPDTAPEVPGFEISGASFPADETGGDYYDYLLMVDGYLGVVLGDVGGHGVGPAILMAETHAYLQAFSVSYSDVEFIMRHVNRLLAVDTQQIRLISLFFARINPQNKTLVYTGAGHNGYHFDPEGNVTTFERCAVPLGVQEEAEFPCSAPFQLQPGDLVLLYTDGVTEAADENGTQYGDDRVFEIVRAIRDRPAAEIIKVLYDDVREYASHQPQLDDMTFVVIKVTA